MRIEERIHEAHARLETVWRVWSDPDVWSALDPEITSLTLDGLLVAGTTGVVVTRSGRHDFLIAVVEPGWSFTVETHPARFTRLRVRCAIERTTQTTSRLIMRLTIDGAGERFFREERQHAIANRFPGILERVSAAAERTEGEKASI
jgi:hypothetical protein